MSKYKTFLSKSYPCSVGQFVAERCDDCGAVIPAWTTFIAVGYTDQKPDGLQYIRCAECHRQVKASGVPDETYNCRDFAAIRDGNPPYEVFAETADRYCVEVPFCFPDGRALMLCLWFDKALCRRVSVENQSGFVPVEV